MSASKTEDISINNIITDINNVISKHFKTILNKYNTEKTEFEEFVKSIPMVKDYIEENNKLKEELAFLKKYMQTLSQQYTNLFLQRNNLKLSVSFDNNKTEKKSVVEKNSWSRKYRVGDNR